ncbi:GntR family transcriptional regulator [Jhaorihella thermophila]|uniref:DNA-binding transcriptional regulator, GntR family n=1 Tax=Jhaorihella thermophila TaxID=488547 RepID=A0A1H5YEL8_9RHOB|nr:GntR family transcriptional regulator [Jhaorihella thermophila]SEG22192.1 DNA-binding transcriptional regulator, GntR family [Jhaorihella thermophila]
MKIQAVDIGRTASAASIIFDALRKAIIEGDLKDGEPLRQDELAKMFNTSRIPVREALTRLEQHGLVRTVRYKGAVVAGLSADEAAEIFDFRALLEGEVIARAVPLMTPSILAEARGYCDAFHDSGDPMEWGDLNRKFHATLYAAANLPYHMKVINSAMDQIDRYLRAQLLLSKGMERANKEHLAILAACEAGESEKARRLTQQHILGAKASLIDHLK